MKITILLLSLLTSFTIFAGDCTKSDSNEDFDSPIAYMEDSTNNEQFETELVEDQQVAKEYFQQLMTYLRESEDIAVQLFAIESLYGNININEAKTALKRAINIESTPHTLYLAASTCGINKELMDWCHKLKVHEIHQQVDPENAFSYIMALHGESSEINSNLIQKAANNSRYASSFFFENTLEIAQLTDDFNRDNSELLERYQGNSNDYIEEMMKNVANLNLVEKGLADKNTDFSSSEFSSMIMIIGINMAKSISFKSIFDNCKLVEAAEACLLLGEVLFKSNTMISSMIGASLITESQKLLDYDVDEINKTKETNDKNKLKSYCYYQIEDIMYAQLFNKQLGIQYIKDAKNIGEFQAIKKLAFSVYEIEKQNGFNPNFDPKDCD